MSDVLIQSLITAALTLGLAIVGAWKLNAIAKTTALTHDLVNSASLVQLRLYAAAVRRIATITGDADDAKVAEDAEKLYREHEDRQAKAISKHGG